MAPTLTSTAAVEMGDPSGPTSRIVISDNLSEEEKRELFLLMLDAYEGNVTEACTHTGIARSTYYAWCKKLPGFKEACLYVTERLIDIAEDVLIGMWKGGENLEALKVYLRAKAKHRGYVERKEVVGVEDSPVVVLHKLPEDQLAVLKEAAKAGARAEVLRINSPTAVDVEYVDTEAEHVEHEVSADG